jgi:hypothetical protein
MGKFPTTQSSNHNLALLGEMHLPILRSSIELKQTGLKFIFELPHNGHWRPTPYAALEPQSRQIHMGTLNGRC